MSTSATSGSRSSTSVAALGRRAGRADHVAALAPEQQLEALAEGLVVFDEDEPEGHAESVSAGARKSRPGTSLRKHRENSVMAQPSARRGGEPGRRTIVWPVAKDTEKLIRQLSLISYLMAERRPVTATEIRRDVEGYSDMTEDAFARRFYADRAELDSLGIHLTVDKPADGFSEQENYSLAPEAFFLPAVAFSDAELAALQTALSLLDGEFAYAEPLRLALQQLTWGRPSPLGSPAQRAIGLGITGSAGGGELSARLAKIDTAIYRRKRIEFEYYTMQTGTTAQRLVDPYELLFEGGQFYLVGWSHEREDVRVFRLSRIRGKVAYATKAEHDFQRPDDFDPRALRQPHPVAARRGDRHRGDLGLRPHRLARRAQLRRLRHARRDADDGGRIFRTRYAIPRLLLAWAISYEHHVRVLGPPALAEELHRRLDRVAELHRGEPAVSAAAGRPPRRPRPSASPRRGRATPPPSGRSASPASSRSPPCSSRPGAPASGCASRTCASSSRCPRRSCARTSPCSTS